MSRLRAKEKDAQGASAEGAPINPERVSQAMGAEGRLPDHRTELHRTPKRTGEVDWTWAKVEGDGTSHLAGSESTIPETDIWCAAKLLIRVHGAEAEIVALDVPTNCSTGAMSRDSGCGRGSPGNWRTASPGDG
jgi:hypothetical protein